MAKVLVVPAGSSEFLVECIEVYFWIKAWHILQNCCQRIKWDKKKRKWDSFISNLFQEEPH